MTTKRYNLKGNVSLVSEKKIPVTVDEQGTIQVDSSFIFATRINNKHFDNSGILTELKYYDKDSVLSMHSQISTSKSGVFQGSKDYHAYNKIKTKSIVLESSEELLTTETRESKSNELTQKSTTEYSNGLVKKQSGEYFRNGKTSRTITEYDRDESGNEILIAETSVDETDTLTTLYEVNYIEFDTYGNWIKRTACEQNNRSNCLLTIRTIKYWQYGLE